MRPIDADAILNEGGNYFRFTGSDKYYHESIIRYSPTLDCIPVDFIRQVIDWLEKGRDYATEGMSMECWEEKRQALIMLLHEWDCYVESGCKGKYGERKEKES